MPQAWTEEEYASTDAVYAKAVAREADGEEVSSDELVSTCVELTDRTDSAIRKHLDNLSAARNELGLPVLEALGKPSPSAPNKLMEWMRAHHGGDAQSSAAAAPAKRTPAASVKEGSDPAPPAEPSPPVSEAAAFSEAGDTLPPPPRPGSEDDGMSVPQWVWIALGAAAIGVAVVLLLVAIF